MDINTNPCPCKRLISPTIPDWSMTRSEIVVTQSLSGKTRARTLAAPIKSSQAASGCPYSFISYLCCEFRLLVCDILSAFSRNNVKVARKQREFLESLAGGTVRVSASHKLYPRYKRQPSMFQKFRNHTNAIAAVVANV